MRFQKVLLQKTQNAKGLFALLVPLKNSIKSFSDDRSGNVVVLKISNEQLYQNYETRTHD